MPDGSFVHSRQNPSGSVTSTPIGGLDNYEHLDYEPMLASVGELQSRLGVPDFFGQG
jgi:hypothetical protein